jgi:pimeloyl-ACP methyl ester carboxylesterase
MPTAVCDGIETRYEVIGDGPPLLLFSPGGFNATVENWSTFGIYARLNLLEHLTRHFTCVAFDKRESGRSGGRVELVTWQRYALQGAELLDHLGIERARVMGGCIGCSIALAFADAYPRRAERLVLYSPAGGPRYRMTQHSRFEQHAAFVRAEGLEALVALARTSDKTFAQDPRVGPWVSVLRRDEAFAADYVRQTVEEYARQLIAWGDQLFDRDTVPGPAPERLLELEIPALVVPGHDASHATSAARYLEECLEGSDYWDVMPDDQTAENAPRRLLDFLHQQ